MHLLRSALIALLPFALSAADLSGDWGGKLQAGPQALRIVLHVSQDSTGALSATLDSVDQGAPGIVVDTIALNENTLTFQISRLGASYSGTVSADAQSIDGALTQGPGKMPLRLERIEAGDAAFAPPTGVFRNPALRTLAGIWSGNLEAGTQSLRLILRVSAEGSQYRVLFDSPDQKARGIPVTSVSVIGDEVKFAIAGAGASYEGNFDEQKTKITGTLTQRGQALPLELEKATN